MRRLCGLTFISRPATTASRPFDLICMIDIADRNGTSCGPAHQQPTGFVCAFRCQSAFDVFPRVIVMRLLITALIVGLGFSLPCAAGLLSHGCSNCGCRQFDRVCRTVPEVKKITESKYVVECEEVCLPGKSRCEERIVADNDAPGGQRCETVMVPTCSRIVTKKKLKKVTTTIEKPSWKCVVDTVCTQCGCQCGSTNCGK